MRQQRYTYGQYVAARALRFAWRVAVFTLLTLIVLMLGLAAIR